MAQATTIKGGKIRVLLGNDATPIVYSNPCGFTQRSITLNKGLEEVQIPDCTDPDKVDWVGRDATSLSMGISGEGVLASESVDTWIEGFESIDSIPVKVEWEFPAKTITWTGRMHIESMEVGANNGQRATNNVSLQSDGEMVRVTTPATP
ncbi:phage tail tube protein [Agrobacterium cavarae]|uniref:phage tail tube protein n=1 Tax=Agrobacterium cavarae TaxID=2528239 RepID=UPI003FD5E207